MWIHLNFDLAISIYSLYISPKLNYGNYQQGASNVRET